MGPFLEAFLLLIVLPLGLAVATEFWAKRHRSGERWMSAMAWLPVPFLALTLLAVVASQIPRIEGSFGQVAGVVPIYVAFLVVMAALGRLAAGAFGLGIREGRALIFSGHAQLAGRAAPRSRPAPDICADAHSHRAANLGGTRRLAGLCPGRPAGGANKTGGPCQGVRAE